MSLLEWRLLISSLLNKIKDVAAVALTVVGDLAPEGFNPNLKEGAFEGKHTALDIEQTINMDSDIEDGGDRGDGDEDELPSTVSTIGQLLSVCSWRCVKEFSWLLGAIGTVQAIVSPMAISTHPLTT